MALWVVAEAHGVDVVAPHQFEVASHHLLRHIVARIGIVLMDVHALEFDGLPIDQQAGKRAPVATCALLDLDTSEAHAVGDHLLLLPVLHLHIQSVELGLLRAPWANVWYRGREVGEGCCVLDVDRLRGRGDKRAPLVAPQFVGDRCPLSFARGIAQFGLQAEDAVSVAIVEGGGDMEVAYRDLWFCR